MQQNLLQPQMSGLLGAEINPASCVFVVII